MPKYWYQNPSKKDKVSTTINQKITATKKPYFMTYIYPKLKNKYNEYICNNEKDIIRRFYAYNIFNINDLKKFDNKTDEMNSFYSFYMENLPISDNNCVVNRIAKMLEKEFKDCLKVCKKNAEKKSNTFNYNIFKTGVNYARKDYEEIKEILKDYMKIIERIKIKNWNVNPKNENFIESKTAIVQAFKRLCFEVCSNEDELCDILIDLCCKNEKSKQFAWDIVGEKFIEILLNKNNNEVYYPKATENNGEFIYGGNNFIIDTKVV